MKSKSFKPTRRLRDMFPQVKSVTDSRTHIHISVTPKDCKSGRPLRADECALAKATKRQFNADGAVIGMSYSYLIKGNSAVRFKTPVSVSREIVSFDRHHDFAPGEYALSPVSPSQRSGQKARGNHITPFKMRRIVHKSTVRVRKMRAAA